MNNKELFKEEKKIGSGDIHELSGGKYTLIISTYQIGEDKDNYWKYTKGEVYDNNSHKTIFEIERNYPDFWHVFIQHPNGNDYLLAGRDYHGGYSVFDLTNLKEYEYKPEPKHKYEEFFCWVNVRYYKEDKPLTIEVEGCYWGAEFEMVTFDFSNPTKLPLTEISRRLYDEDDYEEDDE